MGANTAIEWCDHTFNPWIGCTRVSPGCQHCYAEAMMDKRLGKVKWGKGQPRQRTRAANWNQVERWNRNAEGAECRPTLTVVIRNDAQIVCCGGDTPTYRTVRLELTEDQSRALTLRNAYHREFEVVSLVILEGLPREGEVQP